jgi:hypothetical protein
MSLGVSEVISYVLIFVIAISLAATAYTYVMPTLSDMRMESEFDYMIIQMKKLDDRIKSVARGGEGAKDSLSLSIKQGSLQVSSDDKIIYSVPGGRCLQKANVSGLYFEFEKIYGACLNKIILNYTNIDIINNASFSGYFDVWIENVGFSTKPLLKVS